MLQRILTLPRRLPNLAMVPIAIALMAPFPGRGAAEETPLLEYGADVATTYVSNGKDVYRSVYDLKKGEPHAAFPLSPAVQPYLTLYGAGGFSLGLWGSFALTDRAPEPDKGFAGLETFDELDYTVSWAWDNRLGSFTVGMAVYTFTDVAARGASSELSVSVAPKALEAIGGKLTHWVGSAADNGGATYTKAEIGGGEPLSWRLSLGQAVKTQDVTAKVGYAFGDVGVALNASYRPNPELVGYDNEDGSYPVNGKLEQYPPTVIWLSVSYGGKVAP